jgi:hypothetical protein
MQPVAWKYSRQQEIQQCAKQDGVQVHGALSDIGE